MPLGEAPLAGSLDPNGVRDPAYPTLTPADPIHPCQTLEPLGFPLDGVATPAIWSRLEGPLTRALDELWRALRLLERGRPARWVSIHYGRISLNAHGWERLAARHNDVPADPALVPPPDPGLGAALDRIAEHWERLRVRAGRKGLQDRVRTAQVRAYEALKAAGQVEPAELDAATLARGPLDDRAWTELLLAWIAGRLAAGSEQKDPAQPEQAPDPLGWERTLTRGIGFEQRFGAELGRRLVAQGILEQPSDVAYLTVAERLRAVHEGAGPWAEHAAARRERVAHFVKLDVPLRFWGRPRV